MNHLEVVGLALAAVLFVSAGVNHLLNHKGMAAYTTAILGKCPVAKPLGYLGGWPIGLYLLVTGALVAYNHELGFWLGAGFMTVATLLFHRDLKSPDFTKGLALIGALAVLAVHAAA